MMTRRALCGLLPASLLLGWIPLVTRAPASSHPDPSVPPAPEPTAATGPWYAFESFERDGKGWTSVTAVILNRDTKEIQFETEDTSTAPGATLRDAMMQLARARCQVLNVKGPDAIVRRAACYTNIYSARGESISWHDGEPLPWLEHVYRHLGGGGPNTWRACFSSDHEVVYS